MPRPLTCAGLRLEPPTLAHRGGRALMSAVLSDGRTLSVAIEAPRALRRRLRPTLAPFLPIAILMAAREGRPLHVAGQVEDGWWTNLVGCFLPLARLLFDDDLVEVTREGRCRAPRARGAGAALMFSAGVDSFYSLAAMRRLGAAPRWFVNVNAGAHDFDVDCWRNRLRNVVAVAGGAGAATVVIDTNFHTLIDQPHVRTHVIRNLCAAFALHPAIDRLVYSSAHSFPDISFASAKAHGIDYLDHAVSATLTPPQIGLAILGWDADRIEKTRAIADDPVAWRHLDVCTSQHHQAQLRPGDPLNCGWCGKCLRTMFTLEHFGALDRFGAVFPLDAFRQGRDELFRRLAAQTHPVDQAVVALLASAQPRAG